MIFSLFRKAPKMGGKLLVVFASQTGAAERIAWLTANALSGAWQVRVAALGGLTAQDLAGAGTLLIVTSTYGAGEAPDTARLFARKEMAAAIQASGLSYAVLALGDRKYDATFCGFGRSLDRWLSRSKARRLFEIVCVDGDDDTAAMDKWAVELGKLGATVTGADLMPGPPRDWTLTERRLLNAGSPGGETWRVRLSPRDPALAEWSAGDIAEVWPRNADDAVTDFLRRHDLNGELSFRWKGQWTFLRDIIAHSRLPAEHEVAGIALEWLVERLEAFPPREYSIASLPASGRMDLLVRKVVKPDGSLGLGSGWLTHVAQPGGVVKLRLRPNPNFRPPAGDGPMILIGAGTGMAGLRAHLAHRGAGGVKGAWLLFGERSAAHDLFYADDIAAWQGDGTLERVDLVFSREGGTHRYVQDLVAAHGGDIRAWLDRGASLMVCGGLNMAAGVQDALLAICGQERLDRLVQAGLYRRDVY